MMFQSPVWLLCLLPVVWMACRPPRLKGVLRWGGDHHLYPMDRWAMYWGRWSNYRFWGVVGACILLLASPGHYQLSRTTLRYRASVVVVVDTSRSMLSMDFKPSYRLQVVKEALSHWVKRNPDVEWGILSMGASIFTQIPLTVNQDLVLDAIQSVQVGSEGEGSNWGVGLVGGLDRLLGSQSDHKWVILVTDGGATGDEMNPIHASQLMRIHGVSLLAIGLGASGGLPIPLYSPNEGPHYERSLDGDIVVPVLDNITLEDMAVVSRGVYQPVSSGTAILDSLMRVSQTWPSQPTYEEQRHWVSWNAWLLGIMLGMVVIDMVLSCTRFRGI